MGGFRERVKQPKVSETYKKKKKQANKKYSSSAQYPKGRDRETQREGRYNVFDGNIMVSCRNSQIFSQGCFTYPRYTHKKGTEKKMCNV